MAIMTLGDVTPMLADDGTAWVAPSAMVMGNVQLDRQSSVWFQSVLRGDNELIHVGARSNIQDGSVLHTDMGSPLTIGENVTVGHMVMLHGCTIGDNSLIGIGSVILNDVVIGQNCLIGANTFIPQGKTIPNGSMVLGSPGKIVRELTEDEILMLSASADVYVKNAERFRRDLKD